MDQPPSMGHNSLSQIILAKFSYSWKFSLSFVVSPIFLDAFEAYFAVCISSKYVDIPLDKDIDDLLKTNDSNIYYINDHLDKKTWTYIFGACCATTVFIPSFHNYRIWSFLGLGMTTYTAWYMAIAALVHGQWASQLFAVYIPAFTYEGDNVVMMLQQQHGSSGASEMEVERLKLDCKRSMQKVQQWKKMV
ncbi:hypothetical protein L6452_34364 [Arctium lappa]|uniref:Uncharacterized protein n=1 Tax=Arctium lappa TaxID=4217 RepID=A0ACB8YI14_ARCLA|nr:hypothetical protein L6452_34364 [Arctium lappa]